jgi:hypothetical protein
MLLKWLFTLLAIIWLYQAILPFFATKQTGSSSGKAKIKRKDDDDGDYIDYEEIKDKN